MEAEFIRFLNWLSSTDDEIVRKIKFVCIGGDLIDGIGIFPNQDRELLEMDTIKQMTHAIDLLAKIPNHIKVFIIPGNHDQGRRASHNHHCQERILINYILLRILQCLEILVC